MPKLEFWGIVGIDPYASPEMRKNALCGKVTGHSRLSDGSSVTTSLIIGKKNGKVITNSGTEYELGNPAEEYEQAYPNAKVRLFASLKELS